MPNIYIYIYIYIIVRTPSPFLFKGGGGVNVNYLPWRGGNSEKLKKEGGSMVEEQVFLKGGIAGIFYFHFFKVYHFYN